MKKVATVFMIALLCLLIACGLSACGDRRIKTTFAITFDTQGGSAIPTKYLKSTDVFVLPEPPTKDGFEFDGWYTDSEGKFKFNPNTFKVNADVTLYARWVDVNLYPHTITAESDNLIVRVYDGDVGLSQEQLAQYADADVELNMLSGVKSDRISVTVRVWKQGYELKAGSVKANGVPVTEGNFVMPAENVTITFEIVHAVYKLSLINPANGEIIPDCATAIFGQTVSLLVIPEYGYRLNNLKYNNNDIVGSSFLMPSSDAIITAEFVKISGADYSVNIEAENGQITADRVSAKYGEYVTLTALPNEGHYLASLAVNGKPVTDGYFLMPDSAASVAAVFLPINYAEKYLVSIDLNMQNGGVGLLKIYYSAGEKVTPLPTPLDGYAFSYYVVDSQPIYGNSFIMPDRNVDLSAVFERTACEINASIIGNGSITTSDSAYPGELVSLTVTPGAGYVLKHESLKINGEPFEGDMFIMPDTDVVVSAEFILIETGAGTNLYTITVSDTDGGEVVTNRTSADPGDIIFVTVQTDENYRLAAGSLTVGGAPCGAYFRMPSENVIVSAEFERIYAITDYEAAGGFVFADKIVAAEGETITLTFGAYGEYTSTGAAISYNGNAVAGDSFVMPAGDVILYGVYQKQATESYSITCFAAENGSITADLTSAAEGRAVTVTAVPASGYKLESLFYIKESQNIPLARIFLMPAENVGIRAVFAQVSDAEFDPNGFFDANKQIFAANGGELNYFSAYSSVNGFLSRYSLQSFAYCVDWAFACDYITDFVFIKLNITAHVPLIAQKLAEGLRDEHGGEFTSALYGNYLLITSSGAPKEDYSLIINGGLTEYGGLLLYTRPDGSFGLLSAIDTYAVTSLEVPNTVNGTAVTRIYPKAFSHVPHLQSLSLGVVGELADYALYGLQYLTSIDLGRVKTIGENVFYDCFALSTFRVASYNTVYSTDSVGAALYEKFNNKKYGKLKRYAPAYAANEYNILNGCQSVASYAFYGAPLTTLRLVSVFYLEDYALFGLDELTLLNTVYIISAGRDAIYWQGANNFTIELLADSRVTTDNGKPIFRGDGVGGSIRIKLKTIPLLDAYRPHGDWSEYSHSFYYLSGATGPFVVYFESNGGSYVKTAGVNNGVNVQKPADPVREGYTFAGWYTDEDDMQNAYNFNVAVASDLRLFAKWEPAD